MEGYLWKNLKSELHIVGICGSLRKESFNRGLLRAFEQQLPDKIKFTEADISELPFLVRRENRTCQKQY
ncbi:hypothetical protein GCM10020331_096890 [Ectobacillus funiculus]